MPESPIDIIESFDSNRLYDKGLTQRVVLYPYEDIFDIDTPDDARKVEKNIKSDPLWSKYNE